MRFANPNAEIDMSTRLLCYRSVPGTVTTRRAAREAAVAGLSRRPVCAIAAIASGQGAAQIGDSAVAVTRPALVEAGR
ncbi:MAG: hypothetical protein ACJ8G1_19055 [Vitreoscilla sp.]